MKRTERKGKYTNDATGDKIEVSFSVVVLESVDELSTLFGDDTSAVTFINDAIDSATMSEVRDRVKNGKGTAEEIVEDARSFAENYVPRPKLTNKDKAEMLEEIIKMQAAGQDVDFGAVAAQLGIAG